MLDASGSVVVSVPTVVPDDWFSATVATEIAMPVGALFVLVTTREKSVLMVDATSAASVAWTRTEYEPFVA